MLPHWKISIMRTSRSRLLASTKLQDFHHIPRMLCPRLHWLGQTILRARTPRSLAMARGPKYDAQKPSPLQMQKSGFSFGNSVDLCCQRVPARSNAWIAVVCQQKAADRETLSRSDQSQGCPWYLGCSTVCAWSMQGGD